MTSTNIHTCSLHEKVILIQPVNSFCTRLLLTLPFDWILSQCFLWHLFICKTVLCKYCSTFVQSFLHKSEHVTLRKPARNNLAPIENVWDILWCNARGSDNVRTRLSCVVNGERSPRLISGPLHVWCFVGVLPVCWLTDVMPFINLSMTLKMVYPVLWQIIKYCKGSTIVIFIGYMYMYTARLTLNAMTISVKKKKFSCKRGKLYCLHFFLPGIFYTDLYKQHVVPHYQRYR